MMKYNNFLNRVIDDGIIAAKKSYADKPKKLKGAVAGFEACRNKTPRELWELLEKARTATREAQLNKVQNYWEVRCYEAEIEWVCNCVSASLTNQCEPGIIPPTARGMMKAAEILGVKKVAQRL